MNRGPSGRVLSTLGVARGPGLVLIGLGLMAVFSTVFSGSLAGVVPEAGYGPQSIAVTGAYAYLVIGLLVTLTRRSTPMSALGVALGAVLVVLIVTSLVFLAVNAGTSVVAGWLLWQRLVERTVVSLLVSPIPLAYSVGVGAREGAIKTPIAVALGLYMIPLLYFPAVGQQFGGVMMVAGLVLVPPVVAVCLPVFAAGLGRGLLPTLQFVGIEARNLLRDRAKRLGLRSS